MHYPFLTTEKLRPLAKHLVVGAAGEDIAAAYLVSIGYDLRGRNVRMGKDEIDIIAWDPQDKVLVFVEVKTRSDKEREGFHPEHRAGAKKRKALRRAARHWVANHNFDGGYRIDLVDVDDVNGWKVSHHFKELAWD